ncbi:transcription repressor OFP14-like [Durio zibethinus]|uniref:Transcription repressor n=1 Tax=Durio zibethinus TaxID=66656 RepID=A0A6P5WYW2_DURZI|nr:transcription repressor OFP14-like [Durio zibethinus]
MSKKLQKSLQDYLSKIKKPSPNFQFPSDSFSSSKKWILKGCKQPKTLSFAVDRYINHDHQATSDDNNDDAATLSDVDRFLFENFKSLYINDDEEINERRGNVREDHEDHHDHQVKSPGGILFESPRFVDPPPDLCGSNTFFVATGLSSSLMEEARSSAVTNTTVSMSEDMGSNSTSTSTNNNTANNSNSYGDGGVDHVKSPSIPNECIAVLTYSPNPYDDFRRSMQEMVEVRLQYHSTIDWDFMEELLFCYLNLNDKKSYKFILSAFVDLIVVHRQNDRKIPASSRNSKVNVRDKRSRRTRHKIT